MIRVGPDDRIKWTTEELRDLYRLKKEGKSFREIARIFHNDRGFGAYNRKYKRMNWDSFFKDPDVFFV